MTEQELQAIKERAERPAVEVLGKSVSYIAQSQSDTKTLIAEVERLHQEIKRLQTIGNLQSQSITKLITALEFYAKEKNYENISFSKPYSKISEDFGVTARKALEVEE